MWLFLININLGEIIAIKAGLEMCGFDIGLKGIKTCPIAMIVCQKRHNTRLFYRYHYHYYNSLFTVIITTVTESLLSLLYYYYHHLTSETLPGHLSILALAFVLMQEEEMTPFQAQVMHALSIYYQYYYHYYYYYSSPIDIYYHIIIVITINANKN